MNIKEVKEVMKNEGAYQDALGDVYFDKKINNYTLITAYEKPLDFNAKTLLLESLLTHHQVTTISYRI